MKLLRTMFAAALLSGATASVAAPIALPAGPLFIQYTNAEQFSATNAISTVVSPGGAAVTEGNWGIVQVSSIVRGTVLAPTGSDIQGGGTGVFADGFSGGTISGIFYGVQVVPGNPTRATSGFLDLYWQDGNNLVNTGTELSNGANLAKRTDQSHYTGFTTGTLLLHAAFGNGCDTTNNADTVCTAVDPTSTDGTAKSYQNVISGLWANQLNTNFFTLDASNNPMALGAKDLRTDSNFTHNGAGAWNVAGTNIVGLRSNDPVRAFALPEPDAVALLGVVMFVLGWTGRRPRKQD